MMMEKCSGTRVIDIAEKTALSRPAVSHHIQILKDAGLVSSRKEGIMIYYSLRAGVEEIEKLKKLVLHIEELLKFEE